MTLHLLLPYAHFKDQACTTARLAICAWLQDTQTEISTSASSARRTCCHRIHMRTFPAGHLSRLAQAGSIISSKVSSHQLCMLTPA